MPYPTSSSIPLSPPPVPGTTLFSPSFPFDSILYPFQPPCTCFFIFFFLSRLLFPFIPAPCKFTWLLFIHPHMLCFALTSILRTACPSPLSIVLLLRYPFHFAKEASWKLGEKIKEWVHEIKETQSWFHSTGVDPHRSTMNQPTHPPLFSLTKPYMW